MIERSVGGAEHDPISVVLAELEEKQEALSRLMQDNSEWGVQERHELSEDIKRLEKRLHELSRDQEPSGPVGDEEHEQIIARMGQFVDRNIAQPGNNDEEEKE